MGDFIRVIIAWVLLHCMSVSLAILGFERTIRLTLHHARAGRCVPAEMHDELADRVARAVKHAKRWHMRLTTEDCLPVALTGMCMLRRLGVEADLVLGVRRYPFAAHAWVVAAERVIDFPPNEYKRFYAVNMSTGAQSAPRC